MTHKPDTILSDEDGTLIITSVVAAAGPAGIEEPELLRQADLIAEHVTRWKTGAAIYRMFTRGEIRLALTDDETDVRIITTEPNYPARSTPLHP